MSLSFKESLEKNNLTKNNLATAKVAAAPTKIAPAMMIDDISDDIPAVMTLDEPYGVAAYAGDDGSWTQHSGYAVYNLFDDNNMSIVDDDKNIRLDGSQFNITQEENSQYIPFEMNRRYDGFDLVNTIISIHYQTKGGRHGASKPVNVTYNNDKIRFGWLVDAGATADAGQLKFEIHAYGTVEGVNAEGRKEARGYIWKSKSNDTLHVIQSLCDCEDVINHIDDSWVQELITDIAEKIALEVKDIAIGDQVDAAYAAAADAQQAADEAKQSAASAKASVSEARKYVESASNAAIEAVAVVLDGYAQKDYVDQAIAAVDVSEQLKDYATISYVDNAIEAIDVTDQLENYATLSYVDVAIKGIDVTDQLENYVTTEYLTENYVTTEQLAENHYTKEETDQNIANNLESYATKEDVATAITEADISSKLNDYYKKSETYSQREVDDKLKNVSVDLTGYATEKFVTDRVDPLSSSIATNTGSIASLSSAVADLQKDIESVDTSARLTYDVAYNDVEDTDVGENVFVFYEILNEGEENEVREAKKKFTIVGGGGGSATSSSLKIGYVTTSPLVVTVNDEAIIKYTFSGTDSSGDIVTEGVATWKINGRIIATNTAVAGENEFNITEHLAIGTQKVNLSIVDDAGSLVTKSWNVQKIDVKIESTFNDRFTYPIGPVTFDYTPYGAIAKDIHFVLDDEEIGVINTTSSGIPTGYDIPAQTHGAHLLEVYMTAKINGNDIESNHIVKDIIWYDSTSTIPVIGTTFQNFTARQYDATNIEYTVYDPTTETPTVEIKVDGVLVSNPTLDKATNIYSFKTDVVGEHTITISCGKTTKTLKANVEKLDINVTPVTAGLVFDFNPSGKSNNDTDRVWSTDTVAMTVSDNFDWVNGGYQYDENGDQYFCVKAGTSAEIDYKLFADEAKKNGKEFKLVFKTTNVAKPDATFLSCMDNTTGSNHIGIQMDVHEANIYGQAGGLQLPYSEEDIIEFEFNISKNTEDIPMVMGYEDGVSTRPMVYDDSYNFTQNTPKVISLGSEDCDLHIYRFKVYNTSLTDRGILNNFIADARNAQEMINRYDRNQIYDENSQLDPDILAEKCPWLRVYKISAPYFTNNKSDKVPGTTIQQIYKNGDTVLDNWTCYNAMHSGQGTSSNNYGAAGRNLDFIMNDSGVDGVKPYFVLGDGSQSEEITMTRTSVPVAYLNAKVNIASSNNMTNAMLANRYNEFNPYNRPFIRGEGVDTSFIKDTMEFHNCVIFIQETNEDLSTHREFADKNWHFYAIGNIGDSKKTDKTRKTDIDDPYEFCVEIMDVELPLSDWPADTMYNAMGYKEVETTGGAKEKVYTWAKDENLDILYEKIDGQYVLTSDEHVDLNKTYYVDILEHDDFSEDFTYGWRYISNKKDPAIVSFCKQKWIEFYRFVTTSTDEEFKARLSDYIVVDSALYYYLFTTRYCMADNRAKNLFFHYSKTNEVDSEGNPIRKFDLNWGYDMDTSLGLNNYGKQVYRYGLEDIDRDEKGEEVFREMDSTFFCRIRDLFGPELKAMYNTLESQNAWHAESFINKADAWQSEFPEELWRLDILRKYIRTYNGSFINGKGDAQFLTNMSNGKMKYHRRQWERSQEKYMASKYQSSVASGDNSVFRCSVPDGDLAVQPNYRLKLTPYAYMYLNVKYGTQSPIQLRAEPNKVYEIPFDGTKADIVDVYSSSLIQDFGDLSSCYVATADTSKASKVKQLIFGNETPGYDNPNFTTLTTGANYLLEVLNIENVSGLTQSLNLSALNNLRELYAHGSNIGGVTFADGGRIEIAELPAINAMTIKNLLYLTTLDVVDFSKLTTLTVENCNTIDLSAILDRATNINRVRLIGIDWNLEDATLLEKLYMMKGLDKDGYNTDQSVLTGSVHVNIIRQQQLNDYKKAWPDLEIVFNTMIEQFAVTFVNDDGTVLDVQYVNRGLSAVDPVETGRIPTPTKVSSVSTDFTYAGWDIALGPIHNDRTIKAIYTESVRRYTIKYVSRGITMQESTALYGDYVEYTGVTPTYTGQEEGFRYFLFSGWDKSGFVDGNKIINANFDEFAYTEGCFADKELANLSNVQIYALTKMGLDEAGMTIEDGDPFSFEVGYDVDYDDIESEVIISEKTNFDGTKYVDTGINLFTEDRDFVLALDYEYLSNNSANATLAQCFKPNGSRGFKLWFNNSTNLKLQWGDMVSSTAPSTVNQREMLVLRHKAGENTIYVYTSNLSGTAITTNTLTSSKDSISDATFVLGCAKENDGEYNSHSIMDVYWCKVWYQDLGDSVCRKLAGWTHEKISFEMCGKKRFYLTEDPNKRTMISLLATHVLERTQKWDATGYSTGGWAEADLNNFLNTRLYNAMPQQIKSLLKQVTVHSSLGNGSSEIGASECYITIPAMVEISSSYTNIPYVNEMAISSGKTISYMLNNTDRRRSFADGTNADYWLRSPNASYTRYIHYVSTDGHMDYYYAYPYNTRGVLIEISF